MERTVTALKVQKRNPNRVNVYLDGEFAFGLARITAAWLKVGQALSEEKIARLQSEDTHEAAFQRAVHFISYRPRSSAEVRRSLEQHALPEEVIQAVIERLQQNGMLDDQRFARTWVENRSEFRARGRRLLAMELHQKGLGDEMIDEALESLNEEDLAYQAAVKQSRKLSGMPKPDFKRKLAGFLMRRGFGYDVIEPLLEKVWQESNDIEEVEENE